MDANSDLRGADLTGAELQGADLSDAQLQGVQLRSAELQKASLYSAKLQWADLRMAEMQEAKLSRARLQGANLREANLQKAFLWGADLQWADLRFAQLQGGDLSEAQLNGAQLQGANLLSTELSGANLENAQLQVSVLSGAQLQGANLSNAQLQGAQLNDAHLRGAIVGNTAFQQGRLPDIAEVAYNGAPFYILNTDWDRLSDMVQLISSGRIREEYLQRIKIAKAQRMRTGEQMKNVFINRPEVVWLKMIPEWDISYNIHSAAYGLKNNYTKFADKKNCDKFDGTYHPEYLEKINQAFCTSKRLTELCELQFQAPASAQTTSNTTVKRGSRNVWCQ